MKLGFYRQIFKKILISNFMKTRSVEAELFHTDGETERHNEANSGLTQLCAHA